MIIRDNRDPCGAEATLATQRRRLLPALVAVAVSCLFPDISFDGGRAEASIPPLCNLQRSAWCLWSLEQAVRLSRHGDAATLIELEDGLAFRPLRIIEPDGCTTGPADLIPPSPFEGGVTRGDDGWLHFTLRLRSDGRCDLEVSQLVPPEERNTEYDRLLALPIYICLGEEIAVRPGDRQPYADEWTRSGSACSLKYS